jgi:hypothetical protein
VRRQVYVRPLFLRIQNFNKLGISRRGTNQWPGLRAGPKLSVMD